MQTPKILLIGLDGADWRVLQPYFDAGVMPNLSRLIEMGTSGPLRSTIPTNSAVAWASFMTGRNPGRHGVFDFMQRSPHNRTRMISANSQSIRCETVFHILGRHNLRVGMIHVPLTYPPFPVNGFLVSGMTVPEGASYTYPEAFANELDREVGGFPLNLMDWRFMLDRPEALIDEAIAVTRQRAKVLHYVLENERWDVLIQVFVSPDRLQHPLMHVLDPAHPLHDPAFAQRLSPRLRAYFAELDNALGIARRGLPNNAVLMVLSDHGFRSVHKLLNLKEILKQTGLLYTQRRLTAKNAIRKQLRNWLGPVRDVLPRRPVQAQNLGSPMLMSDLDWHRTRAYTTTYTSQDVVVNLKDREPNGTVRPNKKDDVLADIRFRLLAARDPSNGTQIIKNVICAADLYRGPFRDNGPDLLIIPADGLATCAVEKGRNLTPLQYYVGAHREEGIFIATGHGISANASFADAALTDLAPTILYLAGLPIPSDMDGRVLDLFSDERLLRQPAVYEAPSSLEESEFVYDPEEARKVEERLRGLGYL